MLYAGFAIGVYASIDAAARQLFQAGRLLSLMMDLLFGVAAAVITALALVLAADGELRLYSLLGALCGYLIYVRTLAPLLSKLCALVLIPLRKSACWISKRSFVKKLLK